MFQIYDICVSFFQRQLVLCRFCAGENDCKRCTQFVGGCCHKTVLTQAVFFNGCKESFCVYPHKNPNGNKRKKNNADKDNALSDKLSARVGERKCDQHFKRYFVLHDGDDKTVAIGVDKRLKVTFV